jgi:diguanylate cyclase (GGDEF)-like protein
VSEDRPVVRAPEEPVLGPPALMVCGVVGLALAAYVVTALLGRTSQAQTTIGELAYLVPIVATVICSALVASRLHSGIERRFWLYLTVASLLLLVNEGFYSGRMILGLPPQFGDTALVPLVAGLAASLLIVVVVLLLVLPTRETLSSRVQAVADTGIAMILLTLTLEVLLIDSAMGGGPYPLAIRVLAAFRVATGLLMLFAVCFAVIAVRPVRTRPYENVLLGGIAAFGVSLVLWPVWYTQSGSASGRLAFYGVPALAMTGLALAALAAAMRLSDPGARTFALRSGRSRAVPLGTRPWLVPLGSMGLLVFLFVLMEASGDLGLRRVLVLAVPPLAVLLTLRSAALAYEVEARALASVTDPVSGLGTMTAADQSLDRDIEVAGRFGSSVSLIVVDLDRFGDINEIHGHAEGDRALAAVGEALSRVALEEESPRVQAARISGDEFAVIASDAGEAEALEIATRIRGEIGRAAERTGLPLAASMGIAVYPDHASDARSLLVHARDALIVAKTGESGRVLTYDPDDAGRHRLDQLDSSSFLSTVQVLAGSVEQRTPHLSGHGSRVAALAVDLGRRLRLDEERLRLLEIAGELHDIGYIGVPDGIVEKPGPLDASERRVVQGHPEMGVRILASIDLPEVLPWVRAHHERWDGRGYPRGLSGTEIPLGARILAVCDAYDAMTHERPYRRALRDDEALEELGVGRGSAFDPGTVDEFFYLLKAQGTPGDPDGD